MRAVNRSAEAERQLILLCAGTGARRQAMAARGEQMAGDLDWQRLAETLRARKLLPTLGPRVLELAGEGASKEFAVIVDEAIRAGRRQGAFLQLISMRAMGLLADAGIRSSALKGPLLGETLYGDPGRRLSSDVDLLVEPEQLQEAVTVIRTLGYEAPTDHVNEDGLPLLHFVLLHEREELPPMELHWRVHWYEPSFARERLLPPAADPTGGWRPAFADQLAALLLFYARDGFVDLRMATDLGAWWDSYGDEVPSGALRDLLFDYPALARVIPAALEVAERVVGLPAAQIIGEVPALDLRQRMAVRLANPNPQSSQSQIYAEIGLIDGLLAPSGDLGAFVRRQLLPPSEVLDQQARHGARLRARSPLTRSTGVVARYALALARLPRAHAQLR